jgi:glycosyltransferase involved in cell wall biosynthesis
MTQRTRILLLIPRLAGGGTEHVVRLLARSLSREKFEIHVGLIKEHCSVSGELPPSVNVHALGVARTRGGALPLLRLIWRTRPQVILSGALEIHFLTLLLRPFFPPRTRLLLRQNGTVSSAHALGGHPRHARLLCRMLYRRADRVICQSRAMAEDLSRATRISANRIVVLPNPVDFAGIKAAMQGVPVWEGAGPHLLAVGRLAWEKGFDLLLQALSSVRELYPTIDLIVAGAGPEEVALKAMCRSLGLDNAVQFAGHVDDPYALFPGTTLFVLSSRHEGMPNALLEALAAGLPVVATPASGGVVDLLRNTPGARLAGEVSDQSLASAIVSALKAILPVNDSQSSGEILLDNVSTAVFPESTYFISS